MQIKQGFEEDVLENIIRIVRHVNGQYQDYTIEESNDIIVDSFNQLLSCIEIEND